MRTEAAERKSQFLNEHEDFYHICPDPDPKSPAIAVEKQLNPEPPARSQSCSVYHQSQHRALP